MPHRTLRIQATEKTHGTVSEQLGTTEDESKFNIAFVPLGCCPPKLLLFTASLSAPLVAPHDSAPTKLAWPLMPHVIRSKHVIEKLKGWFVLSIGITSPLSILNPFDFSSFPDDIDAEG